MGGWWIVDRGGRGRGGGGEGEGLLENLGMGERGGDLAHWRQEILQDVVCAKTGGCFGNTHNQPYGD